MIKKAHNEMSFTFLLTLLNIKIIFFHYHNCQKSKHRMPQTPFHLIKFLSVKYLQFWLSSSQNFQAEISDVYHHLFPIFRFLKPDLEVK